MNSHSFSCSGPNHENQDTALSDFEISTGIVFAIADGIGGTEGGKFAANLAISTLKDFLTRFPNQPLEECFTTIKSKITTAGLKDQKLAHMGTTLSVCVVRDETVDVGHVGDSRVYHLRGNGIVDRTKDQTEIQQLVEQGVLARARARRYHRKHVLLSALSASDEFDFYRNEFSIKYGDRIILMTDGVYNLIPRKQVRDFSVISKTPQIFLENLRKAVEEHGPTDDYTAICAEFNSE